MRFGKALCILAVAVAPACGGGSSVPTSPGVAVTMTGTWAGTASDSSGSMMGAGLSSSMMGNTIWTITQTGNTFSGTMQFAGYMGGGMLVSGTVNGHSGTFTMTMPAGSMMTGNCSAAGSGTFDMDDMMTQFHGTYSGINSCTGPFDSGHMNMHR